ncbi:MAG: thioredoxin domain-containing protein [Acidimicrobiales bacterium]
MNRLAAETSPYLRQHADNPVDWRPWGEEARAEARASDRPILLSIGYSACHWCHVMAHESFEDPSVAAVVNELFVPIKVDREERPDVDAIYMEATQVMTGAGGWPLTAFLTPAGEPFFTGTYFPPEALPGRPSFLQVCRAIDDAWRHRRTDVENQAAQLTSHLAASSLPEAAGSPDAGALADACDLLVAAHDQTWGGFGRAPKFPQTLSLDLLLRHHGRTGDPAALAVVVRSLDAMAAGGIHDHLGGGFARYSVDERWLVPHFEKMLYDEALLARVYLHAWQVTGVGRYRRVLEDIVAYVLRELRHREGGFFAAEDADSEGVEGKFYVWTPEQFRAALGIDAEPAAAWWGVAEGGNFEGATILNRLHAPGDEVEPPLIADARRRLLEEREQRVRPGLDDKVLTEWNALMVATLAEAGAATGNRLWIDEAVRTAEFLLAHLRTAEGRWLRSWQDDGELGRAQHLALAVDYAALVDAFTRLSEATGQAPWIAAARTVADDLLRLFWDPADAGFFTTGDDAERLVARTKDLTDNATPSANSTAALALLRLAALTGEGRYRSHAEEAVAGVVGVAAKHPSAFAHLLAAVDLLVHGINEVAVVGDAPALVLAVQTRFLPGAVLAWGEPYPSPLWERRSEGHAYVCRNFTCAAPVDDPDALVAQLVSCFDGEPN